MPGMKPAGQTQPEQRWESPVTVQPTLSAGPLLLKDHFAEHLSATELWAEAVVGAAAGKADLLVMGSSTWAAWICASCLYRSK